VNVLSVSYGNDSIAMIQWAHENKLPDVTCCYIDTGWAGVGWVERVEAGERLASGYGFDVVRITPEVQFAELMRMKKGFPQQRYQWCSAMLKGIPYLNWLDEVDPDCKAVTLVGKRRAESENRKDIPEFIDDSEYHGGRKLWHPLFKHTDAARDLLLVKSGMPLLPHRSLECDPCVNANRGDFRRISLADIAKTADLEAQVGKTMFRPKRHNGAKGIRQVIEWAKYSEGQFDPDQDDLFNEGCGSPFGCGL